VFVRRAFLRLRPYLVVIIVIVVVVARGYNVGLGNEGPATASAAPATEAFDPYGLVRLPGMVGGNVGAATRRRGAHPLHAGLQRERER
jgi:hypothetical protein